MNKGVRRKPLGVTPSGGRVFLPSFFFTAALISHSSRNADVSHQNAWLPSPAENRDGNRKFLFGASRKIMKKTFAAVALAAALAFSASSFAAPAPAASQPAGTQATEKAPAPAAKPAPKAKAVKKAHKAAPKKAAKKAAPKAEKAAPAAAPAPGSCEVTRDPITKNTDRFSPGPGDGREKTNNQP